MEEEPKKTILKKSKESIFSTPPGEVLSPIWLSVSESAKLGGVQTKTIRRGLDSGILKFKVVRNRYLINLATLATWMLKNTKLRNKFNHFGIGQYVDKWKE
jgi:excisionase family DNA binding protein